MTSHSTPTILALLIISICTFTAVYNTSLTMQARGPASVSATDFKQENSQSNEPHHTHSPCRVEDCSGTRYALKRKPQNRGQAVTFLKGACLNEESQHIQVKMCNTEKVINYTNKKNSKTY